MTGMPDREKVLKALEHHKETAVCNGCPYAEDDDTPQGYCPVYDDALALLREQDTAEHALDVLKAHGWKDSGEAVKPKPTGVEPNYNCGACGLPIQQGYPFCPWCGREVKWDA